MNETEVHDPRQLLLTVSQLPPGSKVKVNYLRERQQRIATATLERRPEQTVAVTPSRDDGVLDELGIGDLTPELRDQLRIPARVEGAVVTRVDPTGAATRQGLREGDMILEIGRKPVRNAEEAVRQSEQIKGPQVLVRVWREGRTRFVVIDEASR